jgi:hypothetical protein
MKQLDFFKDAPVALDVHKFKFITEHRWTHKPVNNGTYEVSGPVMRQIKELYEPWNGRLDAPNRKVAEILRKHGSYLG